MKTTGIKMTWWDRIMAAITFAEAGEDKTAVAFLDSYPAETKKTEMCHQDSVGAHPQPTK